MSSRSATLPVGRSYLLRAWLAAVTIVAVAATVIAVALTSIEPAGGTAERNPPAVSGVGYQDPREPIVVNGFVCRQCR